MTGVLGSTKELALCILLLTASWFLFPKRQASALPRKKRSPFASAPRYGAIWSSVSRQPIVRWLERPFGDDTPVSLVRALVATLMLVPTAAMDCRTRKQDAGVTVLREYSRTARQKRKDVPVHVYSSPLSRDGAF